jgi:hypothetical protein
MLHETSPPSKKKYVYTDAEKQSLGKKHYAVLYEIRDILRSEQYPVGIKGFVQRYIFRRKASDFVILTMSCIKEESINHVESYGRMKSSQH